MTFARPACLCLLALFSTPAMAAAPTTAAPAAPAAAPTGDAPKGQAVKRVRRSGPPAATAAGETKGE